MAVREDSVMNNEERFPVYRRSHGGRHLFRIDGLDRFEELQRIGRRWVAHAVLATAYPEKLRIREMLDLAWSFEPSDSDEWSRAKAAMEG
jgi:hypothetical protein